MSLKARSPIYCLEQDLVEPSMEETPYLSAQENMFFFLSVVRNFLKSSVFWSSASQTSM